MAKIAVEIDTTYIERALYRETKKKILAEVQRDMDWLVEHELKPSLSPEGIEKIIRKIIYSKEFIKEFKEVVKNYGVDRRKR